MHRFSFRTACKEEVLHDHYPTAKIVTPSAFASAAVLSRTTCGTSVWYDFPQVQPRTAFPAVPRRCDLTLRVMSHDALRRQALQRLSGERCMYNIIWIRTTLFIYVNPKLNLYIYPCNRLEKLLHATDLKRYRCEFTNKTMEDRSFSIFCSRYAMCASRDWSSHAVPSVVHTWMDIKLFLIGFMRFCFVKCDEIKRTIQDVWSF